MEPRTLAMLMPILALSIGLAAVVFAGLVRLEKAKAAHRKALSDEDLVGRVQDLEDEMTTLRHQLTEAQERIDFAERLLARPAAPPEGEGQRRREGH